MVLNISEWVQAFLEISFKNIKRHIARENGMVPEPLENSLVQLQVLNWSEIGGHLLEIVLKFSVNCDNLEQNRMYLN